MSSITSNINNILATAPIISANAATDINSITWGGRFTGNAAFPLFVTDFPPSGVYAGSLSSQGNMLAMQLSPRTVKYIDLATGEQIAPGEVILTAGNITVPIFSNVQLPSAAFGPYMAMDLAMEGRHSMLYTYF